MAASTFQAFPSRFGQASGAGDNTTLFLEVFSGEVLTAFAEHNVFADLGRTRTINEGKDAVFPVVGTADATYHVPGENILTSQSGTSTVAKYLQTPGAQEKLIKVDNILMVPILIYNLDEAMSHWDIRGPYAYNIAEGLARKMDISVLQVIVNGAAQADTLSGEGSWDHNTARTITAGTAFETTIATTISTLEDAAAILDGDDIPLNDRFAILKPDTYRMLVSAGVTSGNALGSADQAGTTGANLGQGTIQMFQGFKLGWSNRIAELAASSVTTAAAGQRGDDYGGDFSQLSAVFGQKEGFGTVKLMDIELQSEYLIEYQAHLMLGRYACGHGVLQPGACGAIFLS